MAILPDRTELVTPADGDLYVTTDVSDTTDAATGTDKKITWASLKAAFKTYFDTLYAAALGADDNYVTDAEKVKLSNLSGTNTGDQSLTGLVPYSGATADVDLGTWDLLTDTVGASTSAGVLIESQNQTQVGLLGAGNTANIAWYGNHNYSLATQDTIAAFTGAGKTLGSLATATYPSLTELAHVKGVTSAVQTQLNAKQATITFGTGVETALGVNVGTAGAPVVNGGALGTPSSGTLTNATGLPLAGVVDSTTEALGVGSLEVGHATDTTISRSAAGVIAVEGVVIPSISSTNTLTNKRVTPRILSATSYTTDTGSSLNADNYDVFSVTAQTGALLFNAPGGTPTDGQKLIITVASSAASARALTWNAIFEASTVALPTTTAATTAQLNIGFMYSAGRTKWVCVAVA